MAQAQLRPRILSSPAFSSVQSAYRPCFSTETASVLLTNDLLSASASGAPSLLLSLDLSAAFDCVIHSKLISRLTEDFGLEGLPLEWIKSYLSSRSLCVSYKGNRSGFVQVSDGVPQGSVLGPLLFSVYISPISRLIARFNLLHYTYADDTILIISFKDQLTSTKILQDCTLELSNWFMFNGLLLNPSKSEAIWIGTQSQLKTTASVTPNLTIASSPISPSDSIKIVGVTYDGNLNFDKHVSEICRVTNFHLRALSHIRKCLSIPSANAIACAIVGSKLDYCNAVLSGVSDYNVHRLQVVQNRAAKVVLNVRGTASVTQLRNQLHWLPIANRINYKIALLTFKTLVCHQPHYLDALLAPYTPSRSLRSDSGHLLVVPRTKTVLHSRAFASYAPRLWNRLPQNLRDLAYLNSVSTNPDCFPNLAAFKSGLKTFLFDTSPSFLVT